MHWPPPNNCSVTPGRPRKTSPSMSKANSSFVCCAAKTSAVPCRLHGKKNRPASCHDSSTDPLCRRVGRAKGETHHVHVPHCSHKTIETTYLRSRVVSMVLRE